MPEWLIDGFSIDIAREESFSRRAEMTKFQVEKGTDVSDHIRLLNDTITMSGVVTDTPIGNMEIVRGEGTTPSQDARDKLQAIYAAKQPITIVTTNGVEENMVLIDLSEKKDRETTGGYFFDATFERMRIVENRREIVKPKIPRATPQVRVGKSPVAIVGPESGTRRRSWIPGSFTASGMAIWLDPDIGAWRFKIKFGNDAHPHTTFFVKGTLLDGTGSTDEQLKIIIKQMNAAQKKAITPTAATLRGVRVDTGVVIVGKNVFGDL